MKVFSPKTPSLFLENGKINVISKQIKKKYFYDYGTEVAYLYTMVGAEKIGFT